MSLLQITDLAEAELEYQCKKVDRTKKVIGLTIIIVLLFILMMIIGVVGFKYLFDLSWSDAFFNAAITTATLGIEQKERTRSQQIFVAVYALIAGLVYVSITGAFISYILILYLDPDAR